MQMQQAAVRAFPLRVQRSAEIACDWSVLRAQVLSQWPLVGPKQLDSANRNRRRIALLIGGVYHVSPVMIENYLLNFERTMPLAA